MNILFWVERLKNYRYLLGLMIGCIIVIAHLLSILPVILPQLNGYENFFTPYTKWLSFDTSGVSFVYFMSIPLLCSLSGAQIVNEDIQSGFFWNGIRTAGVGRYAFYTQLVAIISGAVTVVVPLALDWIVLWCFLPNIKPNLFLNYGNNILPRFNFFPDLFYTHPLVLTVIYVCIAGVVGGGYALLTSTIALYINNKFTTLSFGFILSMALSVFSAQVSTKYIQSPVLLAMEFSQKQVPPVIWAITMTFVTFLILSIVHYLGVKKHCHA